MNNELIYPTKYPLELPYGCVFYYDFEDSGNIMDKSGKGYHAESNVGSIAINAPNGYARYFDTTDDKLLIPDEVIAHNMAGNWSIEALVKPYNEASSKLVLHQYTTTADKRYLAFVIYSDHSVRLYMSPDGTSAAQIYTYTADKLTVDAWSYLLVSYELVGAGTSIAKIYINGALSKTATNMPIFYSASTYTLAIGNESSTFGAGAMALKSLGIYNRLFDSAEAMDRYNEVCWQVGLAGK